MEITDYELFDVPPRWIFLKVETSDGYVGWGEVSLSRQRNAVHGIIEDLMEEYIIGEKANSIEDHWQSMYRCGRFRGGPVHMTGISGIDQALWDIKGKSHDVPVYELLGGKVRDRIRLYQHIHTKAEITGDSDEEKDGIELLVEDAKKQVNSGFSALKLVPFEKVGRIDSPDQINRAADRVAAIREAVGNEVEIGLDFHGRASKAMAKQFVNKFDESNPMFYEEAVTGPEHADLFQELASNTSTPIATGERRHSRWDFKEIFESRAVDIVQPDICYAGGISEVVKIGNMAEAYDVSIAPHCPFGPIALAASIQVDACLHNAPIQEQIVHRDDYTGYSPLEYISNPEVFDHDSEGYVDIPNSPGLGVEVDEEKVREMADKEGNWGSAQWRHKDGSIAEW